MVTQTWHALLPSSVQGTDLFDLGSLLNRGPAALLGLDVSSSSVKLVELSQNKAGQLVLERCAIEPLEAGWIVDGNVEKFDEVAEAVRRLVKKSGTRTKNVAMALPASAVITKKIVLPGGLTEAELEIQVESEANQYIPFSLDEVSLDFCVIGPNASSPGDVDVLIAASRKEKVQDRQGLAEAAGLKPVILDVESYSSRLATERLIENLPGKGLDTLVALFEVGAYTTSMQAIRNGDVLYDRDQAFGGAQLTQLISRQYGFSLEEAETKKRTGELPEDYDVNVLKPFVESLAQEIGRALQFFFTSTPHNKVDYIMLAGGSSSLPGLSEAVMRQTSFSCTLVNPFDGMETGSGVRENRMRREAPSYLTSCGLAMRRFLQ
jgi:type IV pilus assembly protein PilM